MFLITALLCMALVGPLSLAMPLESSSSNLTNYFDSRIVGGTDAPPLFPYMVALIMGWEFQFFLCGGSILTEKHVLTAAHCITPVLDWHNNLEESFHGIAGTNTWNSGGHVIKFKSYVIHPEYNVINIKNDCGVLALKESLEFNLRIQPIRLQKDWVDGGVKCYVTGWGTQELWGTVPYKLQFLFVNVITGEQCKKGVEDAFGEWGWIPPMEPKQEICTLHSYGHGMCHGDSGSPLVSLKTGKQVGIVSWGRACAVGAPDMHARVSNYLQFICEIIGKHHCL